MLDAGCHPTEVAQISGHKNLMSLNQYHVLNTDRQKEMSNIIYKSTSVNEAVTDFDHTSNDELIRASQEIEDALQNIHSYEEIPYNVSDFTEKRNIVDLPVAQTPGGSLHVSQFLNQIPHALSSGCTFNCPISVVMNTC